MGIFSYVSIGRIVKKKKIRVDNFIFTLHYRFTFAMFFISSLLVGAKEFFGSPIMCHSKSKSIKGMLNTYCYIMSTFTIPTRRNHSIGTQHAYHGAGTPDYDDEITVHGYYLWVPMVLFLQAVVFYLPHFVWKKLDDHMYESVVPGVDKFSLDLSSKEEKIKGITRYVMRFMHTHDLWAWKFYICELLNFINAIAQIYFTDYFLGGTFLSYGTDVLNYSASDDTRTDPMTRIFPKMAKCTFRKFGPSATIETHDAFCLLSVNIINEKIYIFLWFWLVFLAAITGLWILYRLSVMSSPRLRMALLQARGKWAGNQNLKIVADRCRVGDWFLIYQLGAHMEPSVYGEFLKEFSKEIQNNAATLERKPMLMS